MSENYNEIGQALLENRAFMAAITKGFADAMIKAGQDAVQVAQKATLPNNPSYNMIHGWGSMFGTPQVGIDPEVISAMMQWRGLGEYLPREGVRTLEVFLPFITGVDETSSTEPTTECGDCISGESEACIQHFPTGKICRETKAMTLQKAIERLNRGDIDLNLLNDRLGSNSPWHPGTSMSGAQDIINVATAWALLFELPPLFMQKLVPMVYGGNPVNNNGNAYREFRGLDLLINTGHVDAIQNVTCPALDSDIKDFNYGNIQTTTNPSFHEILEMAHYYVRNNARGQMLDPAEFAVVMRPDLWKVYSSLQPYQSILATLMNSTIPNNYTVNIDGASLVRERNDIRQGMFTMLNGERVRVIEDHGITESNNANDANCAAGEYASDVYVVPLRYLGNRQATRIEYKDYRFINGEIAATQGLIGPFYRHTPDGRFLWNIVQDGRCFKIQAEIEPRIILKTPQLAARIQNVKYVPQQHLREPDFNSPYRFKGGVSTRGPASYYH